MLYGAGFEFKVRGSEILWWSAFLDFSLMLRGIWVCPLGLWNHWASLFQTFSLKCLKVYEQGMKSPNPLRVSAATGEFVVLGDLCWEYETSEILYCLCSNVWVGADIMYQYPSYLEFYGACFPSINSEKFGSLTSTCEVYVRDVYGLCSEEKSLLFLFHSWIWDIWFLNVSCEICVIIVVLSPIFEHEVFWTKCSE